MPKTYKTIKDARNAFALNCGFDPFIHADMGVQSPNDASKVWRKPSKSAMADLGYPVGTPAKDSLFIGCFPTGIVYCDTRREEHGDYVKVAYLNYETLNLDVYKPKSDLLPRIRQDAEAMQAKRGQQFAIAGNMTITLGKVTR